MTGFLTVKKGTGNVECNTGTQSPVSSTNPRPRGVRVIYKTDLEKNRHKPRGQPSSYKEPQRKGIRHDIRLRGYTLQLTEANVFTYATRTDYLSKC